MNANETAIASLATVLNDGVPASFTPQETVDRLAAMEAAAENMGVVTGKAESDIAESAKQWGCNFLNLVKRHNIDGDNLAERCRTRLGWKDLKGEAGSKVKTRFNTWRSNIGKVSGMWDTLDETVQNELLGGTRSFITVYKSIIEAERREKREADAKAAAEAKALADMANQSESESDGIATVEAAAPLSVASIADMLAALSDRFLSLSADEMEALAPNLRSAVDAWDMRVNDLADSGEVEAIAA